MWNKGRKDDDFLPPAPPPRQPEPAAREASVPVPQMTSRPIEPETPRGGSAAIGKTVHIKGQVTSREDLYLDGVIEGTVDVQENRLTIGPNGKVQAGVKAREIVVLGSINGNVEATDKIDIRKDAQLIGDIRTSRIVIEDGAYFKGSIDITKNEQKAAPKPPPVAAPAPAAPAPAPVPVVTAAPIAAGAPGAGSDLKR